MYCHAHKTATWTPIRHTVQGRDILVQPDFWLLIFGDFREDKPGIPFKKSFPPIPVLNDQSFRKKFVK